MEAVVEIVVGATGFSNGDPMASLLNPRRGSRRRTPSQFPGHVRWALVAVVIFVLIIAWKVA